MDIARVLQNAPDVVAQLADVEREPLPDTPILSAKIKLLWRCNLSCVFCTLPSAGAVMPTDTVLNILAMLRRRGLLKIHYSGGEVFLHPDIFTILEASCQAGLQVNLTTNGTLLDRAAVKRLVQIGVHSVSVSLDAADAALHDALRGSKGAFKATRRALELLANHGKKHPKLRVNTVVTADNAHQLDAIHALLANISPAIHWKLIPVDTERQKLRLNHAMIAHIVEQAAAWTLLDESPFSREQLAEASFERDQQALSKGNYGKRYYDAHRCYMAWLHLFIDPAGFVYPCCMSRGRMAALGNLTSATLDEILDGAACRAFRMAMASQHRLEMCRACDDFIRENVVIEELAV